MLEYDLILPVDRGIYRNFVFNITDRITGYPVDLTGYALQATFRERQGTSLLLTVTPVTSSPSTGEITLTLTEADSALLPSRDYSYRQAADCTPFTCWGQIDGTIGGKRYQLINFAVDNVSTTYLNT